MSETTDLVSDCDSEGNAVLLSIPNARNTLFRKEFFTEGFNFFILYTTQNIHVRRDIGFLPSHDGELIRHMTAKIIYPSTTISILVL